MWRAFAYVVLTAPVEMDLPPAVIASEEFRSAAQSLAIEWEILDPREVRWVLSYPAHYESDLRMLRHRQRDLADAPRLADAQRFPDRATVDELRAFNRAFRGHLEKQWTLGRADEFSDALADVDRRYLVWDHVRDAQVDYYYVTTRRAALRQVREMIGTQAYTTGALPCHVPLHLFRSID